MNKEKIFHLTTYFILFLIIIILAFSLKYCDKKVKEPEPIIKIEKKIDTVYLQKDSIIKDIKYKEGKIITKYVEYEKNRDVIISQPVSDDIEFFSKYISTTELGLDSCNNYRPVKEN